MIISLTGFMGCGKSSVGRELSRLLCCPFMDLDSVIEEREGRKIPEIFATEGEAAFRRMEAEALRKCIYGQASDKLVVALGGGTVMTEECAKIVHEKTVCIYLRASVETLMDHLAGEVDNRPMLAGNLRTRIEELMSIRSATYEKTAHIMIDTNGKTIDEIAREISIKGLFI
ncbi:MAG: shikimate kinase [Bacteroidales bacterium]|nr:shikimate kinase [Bacteroidales bacterium]